MPKISPEQDEFIDIFDMIITLGYAYEWQRSKNNAIDDLVGFTEQIIEHILKNNIPLFLTKKKIKHAVRIILSKLQYAVKHDERPQITNFGRFG